MLAPASKSRLETAATIPGSSSQETSKRAVWASSCPYSAEEFGRTDRLSAMAQRLDKFVQSRRQRDEEKRARQDSNL